MISLFLVLKPGIFFLAVVQLTSSNFAEQDQQQTACTPQAKSKAVGCAG